MDSEGNVYAVGYQHDLTTEGFRYGDGDNNLAIGDIFINAVITKYSADGTPLWAKTVTGGGDNSAFNAVGVDEAGNIYAAGYQCGNGSFTYGESASVAGSADTFEEVASARNPVIVKYDSNGGGIWAKSISGTTESTTAQGEFRDITLDGQGNLYVVGYQAGDLDTYNYSGVTSNGFSTGNNAVIVKYNSTGDGIWVSSTFEGTLSTSSSIFEGVAVDATGKVYAVGTQFDNQNEITGVVYYANSSINLSGSVYSIHAIMVAYDSLSGEASHGSLVESSDTTGNSFYFDIASNGSDLFVVGQADFSADYTLSGNFDFGNGQQMGSSAAGITVAVIAKYDSQCLAQTISYPATFPNSRSSFQSISIDGNGLVHVVGLQSGQDKYTYGTDVFSQSAAENDNALIVSYSNSLSAVQARGVPSISFETPPITVTDGRSQFSGIAIDSINNIVAVGSVDKNGYSYTFETLSTEVAEVFVSGVYESEIANINPNISLVKYGPYQ